MSAGTYCADEVALDLFVVLAAHAYGRFGVRLTFEGSANASIEAAGAVSRDANHAPQCADGKTSYLGHVNFCHCEPPEILLLLLFFWLRFRVEGLG